MYQRVSTWVDLVQEEHRVLDFWQREHVFQTLREKNRHGKPWSFLDGPITANNPMGVHHAWGRTLKDAYQRYWAMNGCDLRYQNGFDCQGLWVEVEVEKELGFKRKRDIEAYGIDRFVEACKERVHRYSAIQTAQSIRLGYWMDWDHSYYTMSPENNFMIWAFLKKCHERGLVYRGTDVMPWCARCGTGISQHEMHEGYKEIAHRSVFVRFPLKGRSQEALLVWTTTPWTLTSNVAAAVHPDLSYARVEQAGWTYYLAAECVERVIKPRGRYRVLEQLKGSTLVGRTYHGPFDDLPAVVEARELHQVIPWEEVSATEGTGIVHIAPGCGKEDHQLGVRHRLPSIAPLNDEGIYLDRFGPYSGRSVFGIAPDIIETLRKTSLLYAAEDYVHSYPHCWRCKEELVFRLVDEWFIKMDPWREDIKEVAKQIAWIPSYGLDQELDWLTHMQDWMISKKRYWGLALPIWVCSSCDHFEVIGSEEELKKRAISGWDAYQGHTPHRPYIDAVKVRCGRCQSTASRIADVGNPWLDAGIVPYSTVAYQTDREYWGKWIPADLVLECFPGQFRNWFYSLLAMSTMMEKIPPFKTLLGHALVRDEHGEEMHKSKGNAIWFDEAVEKIGADVMRWLYCLQDPTINLNFGYGPAKEARGKFFNTFWNTYAFYINYAAIDRFVPVGAIPLEKRADFDRWILSELQQLIATVRKGYETYQLRMVCRAIEEFFEDLSNWYVRHCRRRFWKSDNDHDKTAAFQTLYDCLSTVTRLLAPMLPFLTETIYQNLVRGCDANAPVSVHLNDFPDAERTQIDEKLSNQMTAVRSIIGLALRARETAKVRVRQPLGRMVVRPADVDGRDAVGRFAEMIKNDLNIKEIVLAASDADVPVTYLVKPNFKTLGKRLGPKMKRLQQTVAQQAEMLAQRFLREGKVEIQLDEETLALSGDDLIVEQQSPADQSVAVEDACWISLDTQLTAELKREGVMRDLVRHLQVLRKEIGLELEDRITIRFQSESMTIRSAIESHRDYVMDELLCVELTEGKPSRGAHDISLGDERMSVMMKKA